MARRTTLRMGTSLTVAMVTLPLATASQTSAQIVESLEYSILWDKSVLQPGQVQTGHVYIKVTPKIGTLVAWNTSPGTGQPATLRAIANSIFDIKSELNGLTGILTSAKIDPDWSLSALDPEPDPFGGFTSVAIGQFGWPANPTPNAEPFISPFSFVWDPMGDYTPREVSFAVAPKTGKVFLDAALNAWVAENAVLSGSSSSFLVAPAPGSMVLVLGAALAIGVSGRHRSRA